MPSKTREIVDAHLDRAARVPLSLRMQLGIGGRAVFLDAALPREPSGRRQQQLLRNQRHQQSRRRGGIWRRIPPDDLGREPREAASPWGRGRGAGCCAERQQAGGGLRTDRPAGGTDVHGVSHDGRDHATPARCRPRCHEQSRGRRRIQSDRHFRGIPADGQRHDRPARKSRPDQRSRRRRRILYASFHLARRTRIRSSIPAASSRTLG